MSFPRMESLLRHRSSFFEPHPLRNVALNAPRSQQHTVLDNANHAVEKNLRIAMDIGLARLALNDTKSRADIISSQLDVSRILRIKRFRHAFADKIANGNAVHLSNRFVALRQVGAVENALDDLVFGKTEGNGFVQILPEDTFRAL